MAFLKKEKVADLFLSEANPYSQKRSIKAAHVGFVLGILVVFVMILGSYFDSKNQKEHQIAEAKKAAETAEKLVASNGVPAASTQNGYVDLQSSFSSSGGGWHTNNGTSGGRQYSASQLIKRGESAYDMLPIGTLVKVKLLGRVESADQKSPVIALVTQSSMSPSGAQAIPLGTKVIGQGQIDVARERLQVAFNTLVFPEGEQYSFSGFAAMPDGSSGVAGDFSSGALKRHASQFIGNFIGGMAQGLKDRTTGGKMGIPFEQGSLKNGALNGIAQSSLDYARSSSEEMGRSQASMQINDGQEFVIYLSREFHP